jgi:hypothetical protein
VTKVQEYLVNRFGRPSKASAKGVDPVTAYTLLVDWSSPIQPVHAVPRAYRHELSRLWQGVVGGEVLEQSGTEAIVSVPTDELVTIFYTDGAVRSFVAGSTELVEIPLSTNDYFTCRAVDARDRVKRSRSLDEMIGIALGVIDLFYLSTMYDHRAIGRLLRGILLSDFFRHQNLDVLEAVRLELERVGRKFGLCSEVIRLYPRKK